MKHALALGVVVTVALPAGAQAPVGSEPSDATAATPSDPAGTSSDAAGTQREPAAVPSSGPAAVPSSEPAGVPSSEPAGVPLAPLELTVALGLLGRRFDTEDDLFSTLYAYELEAAPIWRVGVAWFPGAYGLGFPWLGVTARFEQGVALQSRVEGRRVGSATQQVEWGIAGRFRRGALRIDPRVEYGRHRFSVDPIPGVIGIPPMDYEVLRLGLDVELRVAHSVVGVSLGQRLVPTAAELTSPAWFPEARIGGHDVGLHLGYGGRAFDVLGGVDLTRYYAELRPAPDHPRALANQVAGGATDRYLVGWMGVRWRAPGGS